MNIPGFASSDKVDRIETGEGAVNHHSVELGRTVIVFNNIGSFTIQEGRKSNFPLVIGGTFALIGLFIAASANSGVGIVVLAIGVVAAAWWFIEKPDNFLLIGTCDGRQTNIVSKDIKFLEALRKFLRDKIDDKMLTAKIDFTTANITVDRGAVAIGPGAIAAGAHGTIINDVTPLNER